MHYNFILQKHESYENFILKKIKLNPKNFNAMSQNAMTSKQKKIRYFNVMPKLAMTSKQQN